MFRPLVIATLLASGAATAAQSQTTGGPAIAYVKYGGSSHEIYLVNPDGTGLKKLHKAARKKAINYVDLKPGGNEIAIVEQRVLKILSLDNDGNPVGEPRVLTAPCMPDSADYNPMDPGLLIIADSCSQSPRIATIRTDGSGYTIVREAGAYFGSPRWLKDGASYVYAYSAEGDEDQVHLCRNACDGGDLLWSGGGLSWLDVGRTTNTLLFTPGTSWINKLDADTKELTTEFINGTGPHYSSDDTEVLYETPHHARGDYLMIMDQSGTARRLTGKGEYGPTDWRK